MYGVCTWTCNKIASLTCYMDSIWTFGPIYGVVDVFHVICMHVCMYLVCLVYLRVYASIYACIECVWGYIYAYMCIYNFEMQGIKEKQKLLWGKGPFGHIAVCIHTKKPPHGAHLCILGASWCSCQGFCHVCWCAAHGKGCSRAHGKGA
jgi:hypothetical protein